MGDIKVGSQWVGMLGGNLQTKVKVRYVTVLNGEEFITYEKTEPDFSGRSHTVLASAGRSGFLNAFGEKEDFFRVGGKYTAYGHTYYVQEVYTVSNPVNEAYRRQARAIVINGNGKRWMEMISGYDFNLAKRVK